MGSLFPGNSEEVSGEYTGLEGTTRELGSKLGLAGRGGLQC